MNKHAGPASALSVLIVGVFAVILHDKNQPASVAPSPISRSSPVPDQGRLSRPEHSDSRLNPEDRKEPSNPPPPSVAVQPSSTPASMPSANLKETSLTKLEPSKVQEEASPLDLGKPLKRPEADRPSRQAPPRTAFTVVREGEKLADVAARVYGSTDSTESLWRANRDQVAMLDSPLPRGTLLRTP